MSITHAEPQPKNDKPNKSMTNIDILLDLVYNQNPKKSRALNLSQNSRDFQKHLNIQEEQYSNESAHDPKAQKTYQRSEFQKKLESDFTKLYAFAREKSMKNLRVSDQLVNQYNQSNASSRSFIRPKTQQAVGLSGKQFGKITQFNSTFKNSQGNNSNEGNNVQMQPESETQTNINSIKIIAQKRSRKMANQKRVMTAYDHGRQDVS